MIYTNQRSAVERWENLLVKPPVTVKNCHRHTRRPITEWRLVLESGEIDVQMWEWGQGSRTGLQWKFCTLSTKITWGLESKAGEDGYFHLYKNEKIVLSFLSSPSLWQWLIDTCLLWPWASLPYCLQWFRFQGFPVSTPKIPRNNASPISNVFTSSWSIAWLYKLTSKFIHWRYKIISCV